MRAILIAGAATLTLCGGCATDGNTDYGRIIEDVLSAPSAEQLTQAEISAGLKEALTVGTNTVAKQLGATDGYFGDNAIRIPLPGELSGIQARLKPLGLSGPLDDLQLKMNRAAEQAAPKAKELVVNAVASMTIEDAVGILRGGDTAATDYLRARTEKPLSSAFRPCVTTSLNQVGALSQSENVARTYLPPAMVAGFREDLTDHAVDGALDGLFHYVAIEEKAIRENPVKRTTELLRRVFGS